MRRSLSLRLLLIVFAVATAVLVAGTLWLGRVGTARVESELRTHAGIVSSVLQSAYAAHRERQRASQAFLQSLSEQLARHAAFRHVEVFDAGGRVIAHTDPERLGGGPTPAHAHYVAAVLRGGDPVLRPDGGAGGCWYFFPLQPPDMDTAHGERGVLELRMDCESVHGWYHPEPGAAAPFALLDQEARLSAAIIQRAYQAFRAEVAQGRAYLGALAERMIRHRDVAHVGMLDEHGRPFVHAMRPEVRARHPAGLHERILAEVGGRGGTVSYMDGEAGLFVHAAPLELVSADRGPVVGGLELLMDVAVYEARVADQMTAVGGMGLLLLAATGVLLAVAVRRLVVRPVVELEAAARGMAAGDLERRIPWRRGDELGRLAGSFNAMADRLRAGRQELEGRVARRTAQLQDSETRYRRLVESIPVGVLECDRDGRITFVNDYHQRLFGYRREELAGRVAWFMGASEDERRRLEGYFREWLDDRAPPGPLFSVWAARDGREVHVQVNALMRGGPGGGPGGCTSVVTDITQRVREEDRRVDQLRSQRDLLVREVHHRIKNNLQGVAGLLHQHAARHPELEPFVTAAVAQLNSVAVVHGIQGTAGHRTIYLCEMVGAIATMASRLTDAHVAPHVTVESARPVRIAESEGVSVALVLNELVFNAIKHSVPGERSGITVTVDATDDGDKAWIRVRNPGARLPAGFDFAGGTGLGTGLSLVRSLLPQNGATLDIGQEGAAVVAELILFPPVLVVEPAP